MSTNETFKQRLDAVHQWPALYMFKFVVPKEKKREVIALFPEDKLTTKNSRNGKYISFTLKKVMQSSDQVMGVYQKAHEIEGIIAL